MKRVRILLRRCISFSLYSFYMEQNRLIQLLGIPQNLGQQGQIVPVHRPQIVKSHILEHTAGQQCLLQSLLYPVGYPVNRAPQSVGVHNSAVVLLKCEVLWLEPLFSQVVRYTAHIWGNRHAVVVEDNQNLLAALPRVGQPLVGQPAGEGSVSNQGDHLVVLFQHGSGPSHPKCHRH